MVNGHFLIKDHRGLLLFRRAIFRLIFVPFVGVFFISEFFFSGDFLTRGGRMPQRLLNLNLLCVALRRPLILLPFTHCDEKTQNPQVSWQIT